jgi:hypothetical protein
MLRSPGAFGAGKGARRGAGGSNFARIAFNDVMRGDSGKRSRIIVSRSWSATIALSLSSSSGMLQV